MKYLIRVISECVNTEGRVYDTDKFEGENEVVAVSAEKAIKEEIATYRLDGQVKWYAEDSASVAVKNDDDSVKWWFFDAAVTE